MRVMLSISSNEAAAYIFYIQKPLQAIGKLPANKYLAADLNRRENNSYN